MAKDQKPEVVKARVLVGCEYGQPNDVVEIEAKLLPSLSGVVDASPEAVEYALSLAK